MLQNEGLVRGVSSHPLCRRYASGILLDLHLFAYRIILCRYMTGGLFMRKNASPLKKLTTAGMLVTLSVDLAFFIRIEIPVVCGNALKIRVSS